MDEFDKKLFDMAKNEDVYTPTDLNARVREALDGLPARGVGLGRTARVVLCALTATMVLAGTALAAFSAGGFKSVELWRGKAVDGDTRSWYGVEGGDYRYIPMEELSDAVRKIARDNPVADTTRNFNGKNWSAAQELSGVTLPANAFLDGLEIGASYLTVSANKKGPTHLRFWQGTDGLWLTVSADAYTELMSGTDIHVAYGYAGDTELRAEEYKTEKGLSALTVQLKPGEGDDGFGERAAETEMCLAELMVDGFKYHIKVEVDGVNIKSGDEALETLHQVLDAFE